MIEKKTACFNKILLKQNIETKLETKSAIGLCTILLNLKAFYHFIIHNLMIKSHGPQWEFKQQI